MRVLMMDCSMSWMRRAETYDIAASLLAPCRYFAIDSAAGFAQGFHSADTPECYATATYDGIYVY